MEYLLVIHSDPETHPQPGGPGWDELMAGYYAFGQHLAASGIKYSGNPLQPPTSATTVRIREGKKVTTDGPFAETKEWMSGYYLVDVANLDEALALAERIPTAQYGSVEVRPVMVLNH
ncbi:MAG: YciI family protein [Vulcanimicrobiota bacterium]